MSSEAPGRRPTDISDAAIKPPDKTEAELSVHLGHQRAVVSTASNDKRRLAISDPHIDDVGPAIAELGGAINTIEARIVKLSQTIADLQDQLRSFIPAKKHSYEADAEHQSTIIDKVTIAMQEQGEGLSDRLASIERYLQNEFEQVNRRLDLQARLQDAGEVVSHRVLKLSIEDLLLNLTAREIAHRAEIADALRTIELRLMEHDQMKAENAGLKEINLALQQRLAGS